MEEIDFFAEFESLDWDYQSAFEGAVEDIAQAALVEPDSGNILSERLEKLFSDAQRSSEFVQMQQLVSRLGDLCCNNPAMSEILLNSSYLQESMGSHSDDDGHGHGEKEDKEKDKKTKRATWFYQTTK